MIRTSQVSPGLSSVERCHRFLDKRVYQHHPTVRAAQSANGPQDSRRMPEMAIDAQRDDQELPTVNGNWNLRPLFEMYFDL